MLKQRQSEFIKQIKLIPNFVELNYYSSVLGVSDKTLSRDIKYLNNNFFEPPVSIIAKRGVGIALNATQSEYVSILNKMSSYETNTFNIEISNTVRPFYILLYLLLNANKDTSQKELSEIFYVSKSVINSDLKYEKYLGKNVSLVRSTKGTSIRGSEIELRKSIVNILIMIHSLEHPSPSSLSLSNIVPKHFENIFEFELSVEKTALIDRLVMIIDSMSQDTLTWEDRRKLYCGIFVLVYKYEMGVELNEFENEILEYHDVNHLLFPIANYLYREINDVVLISESEISYILKLLNTLNSIKKIVEMHIEFEFDKSIVELYADDFIDAFSAITEINLRSKIGFSEMIRLHIRKMIQRVFSDNQLENNILSSIQQEYKSTLDICSVICGILEKKYKVPPLSIDEISYLTLYIQSELINFETKRHVAIVVESKSVFDNLLRTQLEVNFSNWEISSLSIGDIADKKFELNQYNFILNTTPSHFNIDIPVLKVGAILNSVDLIKIKKFDIQVESVFNNLQLKLKQIINDLSDIGVEIIVIDKEHHDLLDDYIHSWSFIGENKITFKYNFAENISNRCELYISEKMNLRRIIFYMSDWDYMLFASKLVYLLGMDLLSANEVFIKWLKREVKENV